MAASERGLKRKAPEPAAAADAAAVDTPNKRQRLDGPATAAAAVLAPIVDSPAMDGDAMRHQQGSIYRIKMTNFVTYDECELFPGPRLNVVVGPNGSGKSTIVCAICLGLAGGTNLLGRAKELGEFVKHGHDRATIEIDLVDYTQRTSSTSEPYCLPTITIHRTLRRDANASEWRIGPSPSRLRPCTKHDIARTVRALNVQVDNLCQFLPQDRVVQFAALSPAELLRETQKALPFSGAVDHGDTSATLLAQHERLIALRNQEKSADQTLAEHRRLAGDLTNRNRALEKDVQRFRERERHLQRAADLRKKRPWLVFENQRLLAVTLQKRAGEARAAAEAAERDAEPTRRAKDAAEAALREIEREKEENTAKLRAIDERRKRKGEQLEQLEQEIEQQLQARAMLKERERERKRRAEKLQSTIDKLRTSLADLPDPAAARETADRCNAEMQALNDDIQRIQQAMLDVRREGADLAALRKQRQARLADLEDIRKRKLEILRRVLRDSFNALTWLDANRNRFQKQVYGPVLLEMQVPNEQHAKYLEQTIPKWLLGAFIAQTEEDADTLKQELYERQRLRIAVVHTPSDGQRSFRPPVPLRDLSRFGITHYLSDTFQAPEEVKIALCNNAMLHLIAVGTEATASHVETIWRTTELRNFFTPDSSYSKMVSRYEGRQVSTRTVPVREGSARLLSGGGGAFEQEKEAIGRELVDLQRRLADLEQRSAELSAQERKIREQQNSLKAQRDDALRSSKRRDEMSRELSRKEAELRELSTEEDTTGEERTISEKISEINQRRFRCAQELAAITKELVATALRQDLVLMHRIDRQRTLDRARAAMSTASAAISELRRHADAADREFQAAKAEAKRLRDEAEAAAPLTDELKRLFEDMPNVIEELDEAIGHAEAKAAVTQAANPRIIQEYEERQKQLEELQTRIDTEQRAINELRAEIDKVKGEWLPRLEALVTKINISFGKYFQAIGCAGEVSLTKTPTPEDYDQWGLEIRVKFRTEDPLQVLNAHTQSGGERSVATMLYLVSLQDLTKVPFRLVDEINQGMDPRNERMIFHQVVQSACRPGLPQYFLITPKLLPDLHYDPKLTVLCVWNGPYQLMQLEWDAIDPLSERAKKGDQADQRKQTRSSTQRQSVSATAAAATV